MDAQKVNETIALADVLVVAITTRTFESLLLFQCLWVARLDMHVQEALLNKARVAVLARMGKGALVLLQMVMHRRLILCSKVAVATDEIAILILLILKDHFIRFREGLALVGRGGWLQFFLQCLA